jgi:lysophospholipase L1-like esterase
LNQTLPRKLGALLRDTAVVLAMSLGLLLALELALRLFWPQVLSGHSVKGERFSQSDELLGMTYVPGAVWRFEHPEYAVVYAINDDGFRDATVHSAEKAAGTLRILLLGDSFTFGYGVDYDGIWPVLAERELLRRGQSVDLVKAGVEGMNTRSELALLHRLLKRYTPDAVVVGFLINDLYDNAPYGAARTDTAAGLELRKRPARRLWRFPTLHLVVLARRLVTASDAGYALLYLAAPQRGEFLRVPLSPQAEHQRRITEDLLRQLAKVCDSAGTPLAVLSIPQQFQVLYERSSRRETAINVRLYDQLFSRVADQENFAWVPTLDAFLDDDSGEDLFYRLDGHLTPAGNRLLARVFVREVMPDLLGRLGQAHPRRANLPSAP